VITVRDLTRRFGSVRAVDSISFHVAKGEVVGFLGPNGAGKTTTMRILTGYLPATSGAAEVAGFDVLRQSMEVRRRIGYLPESVPLYGEHRVCEMLAFQGRLHGIGRAELKRRIPAVLDRVGVLDRERQLVRNLSRGLRQRVGLAVALLPDPDVLILDEPTSGLDPLQRIEVRKLVSELSEEHTLLVSSHILPEIEAVCPRVIILSKGRIAADGTRAELVAELGGASHVRVEAFVPDPAEAQRLLGTIAGVRAVADRGRLGIHHQFDVQCDEDLREDVGALAAAKGWALRELSWQQASLEEIFARIALDLGDGAPVEPAPGGGFGAEATPAEVGPSLAVSLPLAQSTPASETQPSGMRSLSPFEAPPPAAPPQAAPRTVYNLNPFDEGATRDLGAPKPTTDATTDTPTGDAASDAASDEGPES